MGRQLHLERSSFEKLVIDLVDDESVTVQIHCGPKAMWKGDDQPLMSLKVDGLRWRDDEHHHLGWHESALDTGDSVVLKIADSNENASELTKEELYVQPEKDCVFCRKKSSEVEVLIEKDMLARICNECVAVCQEVLDQQKSGGSIKK